MKRKGLSTDFRMKGNKMRGLDMFQMKAMRNIEHSQGIKIVHSHATVNGYTLYGKKDGRLKKYSVIHGKLKVA